MMPTTLAEPEFDTRPTRPERNGQKPSAGARDLVNEGRRLEAAGDHDGAAGAYLQAISLNRNDATAYEGLAGLLERAGQAADAYLCLAEAGRLRPDDADLRARLVALEAHGVLDDPVVADYRDRCGANPIPPATVTRRILIVTNLVPPQELGGFGRTILELADVMLARGHAVKIIAGDVPELTKAEEPAQERVQKITTRSLRMSGGWKNGRTWSEQDRATVEAIYNHNCREIFTAVRDFKPDVCLAGNIDFLGWHFIDLLNERGVPVIHRLGNAAPGYPVGATPKSPLYRLAGCSPWLNEQVRAQGHDLAETAVLYPGSPLEGYYRAFAPDRSMLRLCFASLVLPYKGPQVLIDALTLLKKLDVPFTCDIAGDTTDPRFVAMLQNVAEKNGFAEQVRWLGFQSREALAAVYARNNVLVFPSVFEEPLGKSQIEAMAAGLLVVSSGTGGSRAIVRDNENGLIFRSNDAEDLARALYYLTEHRDRWAELAAQGQNDCFSFRTLNSVVTVEDLATELLARRQAPRPTAQPPAAPTVAKTPSATGSRLARYREVFSQETELLGPTQVLLCRLLEMQAEQGLAGDLLEIGVFRGATAALLATFLREDERLVLIDPYQDVRDNARKIQDFAGVKASQLAFVPINSMRVNKRRGSLFDSSQHGVRVAHIDGEHSYDAVYQDLDMATAVLEPGGLIVVDDIFNIESACCTHAMFDYLRDHPTLGCIALGFRKAYLCDSRYVGTYRQVFLRAPEILEAELGTPVRLCFNGFGFDRTYVSLGECKPGAMRYQVIGSRFRTLEEALAALGQARLA